MEKLNGAWIGRTTVCAHSDPKGLLTLLLAIIISAPSHANKLLAGYVTLRVLGIPADFTDILLLQTLISFLLYFAPTPGGWTRGADVGRRDVALCTREITPS